MPKTTCWQHILGDRDCGMGWSICVLIQARSPRKWRNVLLTMKLLILMMMRILNQILAVVFLPCDPGCFCSPTSPDLPRIQDSGARNDTMMSKILQERREIEIENRNRSSPEWSWWYLALQAHLDQTGLVLFWLQGQPRPQGSLWLCWAWTRCCGRRMHTSCLLSTMKTSGNDCPLYIITLHEAASCVDLQRGPVSRVLPRCLLSIWRQNPSLRWAE